MSKRIFTAAAAAVLVVAAIVGLLEVSGQGSEVPGLPPVAEQQRRLAGAPVPFNALHADAGRLLEGSVAARIRALRGHPVVVNIWASWCEPCKAEMPIFGDVALRRGRDIAFLGLDNNDDPRAARRFIARVPLSYPSYLDRRGRQTHTLAGSVYLPTTVFVDRRGRVSFIHQGSYRAAADLERDIASYLSGEQ